MRDDTDADARYLASCKSVFWQKVFGKELNYLAAELEGCKDLLSVGCGPAVIEAGLSELGFNVTGLDVSGECLESAPDSIRKVVARAEEMPFPPESFDAVIYVVSLQFIDDFQKALNKTAAVLRKGGRLVILLLNPDSEYYKSRSKEPESYVSKIKHTNLAMIVYEVARNFSVETEYFLGIRGEDLFDTSNDTEAALYVVKGSKL
ncbi:MAG: class I SAM-dependent methyltransferase [Dissulfurispiraceae bacterium]|nr:class I SAM-dependent methyltransferase [Dissulfurispiraceae bacterium]